MSSSSCDRVVKHLSLYVDDRLQPRTRRHLEAHVARCASCARELRALRELSRRVAALPPMPATTSRRPGGRVRRGAVAAAAVILLCLGYAAGRWHAPSIEGAPGDVSPRSRHQRVLEPIPSGGAIPVSAVSGARDALRDLVRQAGWQLDEDVDEGVFMHEADEDGVVRRIVFRIR